MDYFGNGYEFTSYRSDVVNVEKRKPIGLMSKFINIVKPEVTLSEIKADKITNADKLLSLRKMAINKFKQLELEPYAILMSSLSDEGYLCIHMHNVCHVLLTKKDYREITTKDIIDTSQNYSDNLFLDNMEEAKVPEEEWEDRKYKLDQEINILKNGGKEIHKKGEHSKATKKEHHMKEEMKTKKVENNKENKKEQLSEKIGQNKTKNRINEEKKDNQTKSGKTVKPIEKVEQINHGR